MSRAATEADPMIDALDEVDEAGPWYRFLRLDDAVLLVVSGLASLVAIDALVATDYLVALVAAIAAVLGYMVAVANGRSRREDALEADEEGSPT